MWPPCCFMMRRANRQTQSGGVSASTEAGLEDMVDLVRTNAAPVSAEFDCDVSFTFYGLCSPRSRTVTLPPAGVWRMAFETKLRTTCCSALSLPMT